MVKIATITKIMVKKLIFLLVFFYNLVFFPDLHPNGCVVVPK